MAKGAHDPVSADTGDWSQSPPTSSSTASEDVRGGAGVSPDLDRQPYRIDLARLELLATPPEGLTDETYSIGAVYPDELRWLRARVRVLEAANEQGCTALRNATREIEAGRAQVSLPHIQRCIRVALAVLGGDRPHE